MTLPPNDRQYIDAARRLYQAEGTIEIDDTATVSREAGEDGAYVAAWVWVPSEAAGKE